MEFVVCFHDLVCAHILGFKCCIPISLFLCVGSFQQEIQFLCAQATVTLGLY